VKPVPIPDVLEVTSAKRCEIVQPKVAGNLTKTVVNLLISIAETRGSRARLSIARCGAKLAFVISKARVGLAGQVQRLRVATAIPQGKQKSRSALWKFFQFIY
jgi:hypothetical protein